MNQRVVLFRAGDESDPYEAGLQEAGYDCECVPVLEFKFVNESELRQALENPRSYDGLVVTSPRAVEALTNAMSWLPTENVLWHTKAMFAVGPRTASELRRIGFNPTGEGSGSAEMLSEYIVHQDFERPLLFLCGNRRRDTLPALLSAHGVPFEELCVYASEERAELSLAARPLPDWVVFFSPTGVMVVLHDGGWDLAKVRIAAIGETTAVAVRVRGYRVGATAAEPTPDALVRAMVAA